MKKKCSECGQIVTKDKVGNWFVNEFGIAVSHNIGCDNKYLKSKPHPRES